MKKQQDQSKLSRTKGMKTLPLSSVNTSTPLMSDHRLEQIVQSSPLFTGSPQHFPPLASKPSNLAESETKLDLGSVLTPEHLGVAQRMVHINQPLIDQVMNHTKELTGEQAALASGLMTDDRSPLDMDDLADNLQNLTTRDQEENDIKSNKSSTKMVPQNNQMVSYPINPPPFCYPAFPPPTPIRPHYNQILSGNPGFSDPNNSLYQMYNLQYPLNPMVWQNQPILYQRNPNLVRQTRPIGRPRAHTTMPQKLPQVTSRNLTYKKSPFHIDPELKYLVPKEPYKDDLKVKKALLLINSLTSQNQQILHNYISKQILWYLKEFLGKAELRYELLRSDPEKYKDQGLFFDKRITLEETQPPNIMEAHRNNKPSTSKKVISDDLLSLSGFLGTHRESSQLMTLKSSYVDGKSNEEFWQGLVKLSITVFDSNGNLTTRMVEELPGMTIETLREINNHFPLIKVSCPEFFLDGTFSDLLMYNAIKLGLISRKDYPRTNQQLSESLAKALPKCRAWFNALSENQ